MLVHLRLTVPADLTERVTDLLDDPERTTNLVVQRGVCVRPDGDLVECDVAREAAGTLVDELSALGLSDRGGMVLTTPTATPFKEVDRLEAATPGDPEDAVIWRAVRSAADQMSRPTLSYHLFLMLATLLAAMAVIQDSSILVVGAMVVGPEFAAVGAVCVGLVFRDRTMVWRSVRLLFFGFVFAIASVTLLSLLGRAFGLVTYDVVTRPRPLTGFIWQPDVWSVLVALVAGTAGVLALAVERTSTMVGVFISVTTVPAAGNLAVGLAVWSRHEILGSLAQLSINLAGMVLAGTTFLLFLRAAWPLLMRHTAGLFGVSEGS